MKENFGKYLGPTLIDEQEPITAWRTWRLGEQRSNRDVCLTATWKKDWIWKSGGDTTVAECLSEKKRCHVTMEPACQCGLWAAALLTNLLKHGAIALYPAGMLGRVHLWGFVHVYEYGFRASMGRPAAGWLGNSRGERDAERIAKAYKIPVSVGVPTEVIDPDMLAPERVLKAAQAFMAAQSIPAPLPPAKAVTPHDGPPRENLRVPDGRKRCSRCGERGHYRVTCPKQPVGV